VIILVLSCVSLVQAGDRVDSYDLEAVPSGDAKVVNYTKDDYHYWRASLVKHLTENPQDMMEYFHISGGIRDFQTGRGSHGIDPAEPDHQ